MEITAEVGVVNIRQCSHYRLAHSTDTVRSSSQQPAAVPVEKNDQSSQSTATTDMTDMATLQVDGIVGLPASGKNGFFCEVCRRMLKDRKAVLQHINVDTHIGRIEEVYIERFVHQSVKISSAQMIDAATLLVEEVYHHQSAVDCQQVMVRQSLVGELMRTIKHVLPGVAVELFGSSVTQFALISSNVNLNLNVGDPETNQKRIPEVLTTCLNTLKRNGGAFCNVADDFYSVLKVPQLLFQHRSSGLCCELRAATLRPMELTSLLQLYGNIDQRAVKLAVTFRYWAKLHYLDRQKNGHYPGHMFVIMVIHYLQQVDPPVLPVLHELAGKVDAVASDSVKNDQTAESNESELTIAQLNDAAMGWSSSNTMSLGELWLGLLKYYAVRFAYGKRAVSIRQLGQLLRRDRDWGSSRLAVEDPINDKINFVKGISSDAVFDHLIFNLKNTTCYFMQLPERLQWLLDNSSPQPYSDMLVRVFELEYRPAVAHTLSEATASIKEAVGINKEEDEEEEEAEEEEEEEEEENSEEEKEEEENNGVKEAAEEERKNGKEVEEDEEETSKAVKECPSNDEMKKGLKGNSKWKKIVRSVTTKLCRVQLTSSPAYSLDDDFMETQTYPMFCLCCRRKNHIAEECPDDNVPRFTKSPRLPEPRNVTLMEHTFIKYFREVVPRQEEIDHRCAMRDCILRDIKRIFSKAQLELFGSSVNGFGSFSSDADLCLILNESYTCEKGDIIAQVAKELKKKKGTYSKILPITTARVPIVKFFANEWKIECDVSLENILALHNTRLLATYGEIDRRVRQLGYVVKCFAKVCDMCDASSGSLSSYAYILMLIHFLQQIQPPVVPVLQELGVRQDVRVGDWNCYFFKPRSRDELLRVWKPREINQCPVGYLWLQFLWYYVQEFDWSRGVVTIRQLRPISKFEKLWQVKPMCIEDPFNLDHNLAQAVSSKMRMYILMRFKKAYLHHCERREWKDIDQVMDRNALCGDFRAPKFLICDICNSRGHRGAECPKREGTPPAQKAKMNKEPATTPHQRGQPALATPNRALTSAPNQKQRPSPQPVTPAAHNKHKTTVSTPAAPPKQNSVTPQTISSSPKATKKLNKKSTGMSADAGKHDHKEADKHSSKPPTRRQVFQEQEEMKNSTHNDKRDYSTMQDVTKRLEQGSGIGLCTEKMQAVELDGYDDQHEDECDGKEAVLSRSKLKKQFIEQCHGSIDEAKKLETQLRKIASSRGASAADRKNHSVIKDVCRQLNKKDRKAAKFEEKQATMADKHVIAKQVPEQSSATKNARKHQKTIVHTASSPRMEVVMVSKSTNGKPQRTEHQSSSPQQHAKPDKTKGGQSHLHNLQPDKTKGGQGQLYNLQQDKTKGGQGQLHNVSSHESSSVPPLAVTSLPLNITPPQVIPLPPTGVAVTHTPPSSAVLAAHTLPSSAVLASHTPPSSAVLGPHTPPSAGSNLFNPHTPPHSTTPPVGRFSPRTPPSPAVGFLPHTPPSPLIQTPPLHHSPTQAAKPPLLPIASHPLQYFPYYLHGMGVPNHSMASAVPNPSMAVPNHSMAAVPALSSVSNTPASANWQPIYTSSASMIGAYPQHNGLLPYPPGISFPAGAFQTTPTSVSQAGGMGLSPSMFPYTSLPPVAYTLQPGPPSSYTTSHPLAPPTVPTGFTPSRVTGIEDRQQ